MRFEVTELFFCFFQESVSNIKESAESFCLETRDALKGRNVHLGKYSARPSSESFVLFICFNLYS